MLWDDVLGAQRPGPHVDAVEQAPPFFRQSAVRQQGAFDGWHGRILLPHHDPLVAKVLTAATAHTLQVCCRVDGLHPVSPHPPPRRTPASLPVARPDPADPHNIPPRPSQQNLTPLLRHAMWPLHLPTTISTP
jgi:hypothetical protein